MHLLRRSPPTSSLNPTPACSSKQNSRQTCGRCHQDTKLRLHPTRVHLATTIVKSPLHHAAKIRRLHRGGRNSVPPIDHSRHHVFQNDAPKREERHQRAAIVRSGITRSRVSPGIPRREAEESQRRRLHQGTDAHGRRRHRPRPHRSPALTGHQHLLRILRQQR